MKTIRFNTRGSSSAFGNFAPGDILKNIGDAEAAHFVDEACCATYVDDASTEGTQALKAANGTKPAKAGGTKAAKAKTTQPPADATAQAGSAAAPDAPAADQAGAPAADAAADAAQADAPATDATNTTPPAGSGDTTADAA